MIATRGHRREPPGAFRVPAWPVTPLLFIAAAIYVVIGTVRPNPANALLGVTILALGIPAHRARLSVVLFTPPHADS